MSLRRSFVRRVFVALAIASAAMSGTIVRADEPAANLAVAGGSILTGAAGSIGVNEAAGIANQQVNAIAIGGSLVSDDVLAGEISQRRSSAQLGTDRDRDRTAISPGAFSNARGIVQLDQTAGNGNAAINSFALRTRP